jgi:predicted nucleotidyltransferase
MQMLTAHPPDPVLEEITHRLITAFTPDEIYLFGSRARNEAGSDSDYDLLVVVRQASEPGYRLAQHAHSLLWGLGVAADILVLTREQFDSRRHVHTSLPATVARQGRLLYAA